MFASLIITRPAVQVTQTRERLFEFEGSGHNHINDTSTIPMTRRYIFRFGRKSRFNNPFLLIELDLVPSDSLRLCQEAIGSRAGSLLLPSCARLRMHRD
jgi:hypothetical protein